MAGLFLKAYIHELEQAFFEVLDGSASWYEIKENTGLPEERCKKIALLWKQVADKTINKS